MPDDHHLSWGAEALWHLLDPLLPGLSVEVVARTDSTNSRLLDRARRCGGQRGDDAAAPLGRRSADAQPCLLVAEHQTRGRGRLGRDWVATPGASLTFSLALPYAPRDWSGLSLAAGVALAEAMDPEPGRGAARIALKWPNDLWLSDAPGRGRKLGGVLIETVAIGSQRMCVVGVGLNVLPQAMDGLSSGYACLREIDPVANAPQLLLRVAPALARSLQRFESEGFAGFAEAYRARDLLLGQPVTTTAPDCPQGIADGVDDDGALRVRTDRLQRIVSGEVSVRLRDDPAQGGTATKA